MDEAERVLEIEGAGADQRAVLPEAVASARSSAMLVARIAGCCTSVRRSSSSGPSKQSCRTGRPSVSSARSKTARAAADAS